MTSTTSVCCSTGSASTSPRKPRESTLTCFPRRREGSGSNACCEPCSAPNHPRRRVNQIPVEAWVASPALSRPGRGQVPGRASPALRCRQASAAPPRSRRPTGTRGAAGLRVGAAPGREGRGEPDADRGPRTGSAPAAGVPTPRPARGARGAAPGPRRRARRPGWRTHGPPPKLPQPAQQVQSAFNVRAGGARKARGRRHETGDRPESEDDDGGSPEHDGVERRDLEQQRLDEPGGGERHDEADGQTRGDRPQPLQRTRGDDAPRVAPRVSRIANSRRRRTARWDTVPKTPRQTSASPAMAKPTVTSSRNRRTATLAASTSSSTRRLLTGRSGSSPRTAPRTDATTARVSGPRATTVTDDGASPQYAR